MHYFSFICLFLCVYSSKILIVEELFSADAWKQVEPLCGTHYECGILPTSMTRYLTQVHSEHDNTFSRFRVEYLCRTSHCDGLDIIAQEIYQYDVLLIDTSYFVLPNPLTQILGYVTLLYPMRGPQLLPIITLSNLDQLNIEHRAYQAKKYETLLLTSFALRNVDPTTDSILSDIAPAHHHPAFYTFPDLLSCEISPIVSSISVASLPVNAYTDQRLLCLIYTISSRVSSAQAILHSWGRKCHGILFFSNSTDLDNNIIYLASAHNLPDTYDNMWYKSQLILNTIAESSLLQNYDYFLMGGDDLYVIVENLHALLATLHNPTQPIYLGRSIQQNKILSFNTGGAGYILNRKALEVYHELLTHSPSCLTNITTSMEDVMVAQCLAFGGVLPTSYDTSQGELFHPVTPQEAFSGTVDWYQEMLPQAPRGRECCSSRSISFQSFKTSEEMYCMHAQLYNDDSLDNIHAA